MKHFVAMKNETKLLSSEQILIPKHKKNQQWLSKNKIFPLSSTGPSRTSRPESSRRSAYGWEKKQGNISFYSPHHEPTTSRQSQRQNVDSLVKAEIRRQQRIADSTSVSQSAKEIFEAFANQETPKLCLIILVILAICIGIGYAIYASQTSTSSLSDNEPSKSSYKPSNQGNNDQIKQSSSSVGLNSPTCGQLDPSVYNRFRSFPNTSDETQHYNSTFNFSSIPRRNSRIAGGRSASIQRHPWQVSLWHSGSHKCGGSIIAPSWILFAAHCIVLVTGRGVWTVYAGEVSLRQMRYYAQEATATDIVQHNYFEFKSFNNDLALMRVNKPFRLSSSVRTVCLPSARRNVVTNSRCQIAGWGAKSGFTGKSTFLLEAEVRILDRDRCNADVEIGGSVTLNMFCAGRYNGRVDFCAGDDGGPLTFYDKSEGRFYQMGIISWGVGCGMKPGVYTKMPRYTAWIEHKINEVEKRYKS